MDRPAPIPKTTALLGALDRFLGHRGEAWVGILSAALTLLLGSVDWVLGSELSFSIFYLLPVSLACWYGSTRVAAAVAVLAAVAWLAADLLAGSVYSASWIPVWNSLVRLGYFLLVAHLLGALAARLRLQETLARTDPLTGLLNLRAFEERLAEEIERAARYGRPFTLAYVDLDRFKAVNDAFGHAEGDRVLQAVAQALREAVRRSDAVARVGGDEFALLLPETESRAALQALAKVRTMVLAEITEGAWSIAASVGAVTFRSPPDDPDAALRLADDLMYRAKQEGRERIVHAEIRSGEGPAPVRGGAG